MELNPNGPRALCGKAPRTGKHPALLKWLGIEAAATLRRTRLAERKAARKPPLRLPAEPPSARKSARLRRKALYDFVVHKRIFAGRWA